MSKIFLVLMLCVLQYANTFPQEWDAIKKTKGAKNVLQLFIDGTTLGKTFEGFGSLSAGASSRLLYDYAEPYRSEILDYLFKPGFSANIHHLKVEIGGDVNSTDGSEPSIAATREEFEHPRPGYFKRGYEYWLMAEAKKRNSEIIFEGLQWGAPGWIGNGNFFSQDNADFICAWLKGAYTYWGLDVKYVGIWNEKMYDKAYIKLLRRTLNKNGLEQVMIDAGDLWQIDEKWMIADDMVKDPELMQAVGVINSHTPEELNYFTTPNVGKTGKPVWSGESHFYGSDWYAAASWARSYRSYITGGITKVISWSLISSYHDFLIVPGSGSMLANTPWSGHYEMQPAVWALAHINQFAKPGWKYVNSGCKWWASEGSLNEGLSMITLKSPNTNDYSIIIETMDAKEPQTLKIKLSDNLSVKDVSVFRSLFNKEEFIRQEDIKVENRELTITVVPDAIYSLTTTSGQSKGRAAHDIPKPSDFPRMYSNDFENQDLNTAAKYFMDQHGSFEVVQRPDKKGKCLQQISLTPGICWRCDFKNPLTILGDIKWQNYRFSVDVMVPGDTGKIILTGRANNLSPYDTIPFTGYSLYIQHNGNWELKIENGKVLSSGMLTGFTKGWHTVELVLNNSLIEVVVDKKTVTKVVDATYDKGLAAIGTGWNKAYFDNIKISPVN
jgi:hypothetical protein